MIVKVIAFGQIAEITGNRLEAEATDTDMLKVWMLQHFPALSNKKFAIAVNRKVVAEMIPLQENDEVALMPPYSGG